MAGEQWTDRTVRGPSAEYMTPDEFRKLFALPEEQFDKLVKDGTLPPPVRLSNRTVFYTWKHAAFLALWLDFYPGMAAKPEKADK